MGMMELRQGPSELTHGPGLSGIVCRLLLLYRRKRMAGPHPSWWTRLLLAALLSVSFPGDMGESDTPLQHPSL